MWSETVDLRTRPVSDQKIGLRLCLAGLVLCCVHDLVTLVGIMILKDAATFGVYYL